MVRKIIACNIIYYIYVFSETRIDTIIFNNEIVVEHLTSFKKIVKRLSPIVDRKIIIFFPKRPYAQRQNCSQFLIN